MLVSDDFDAFNFSSGVVKIEMLNEEEAAFRPLENLCSLLAAGDFPSAD
jgi:hypothetical protein